MKALWSLLFVLSAAAAMAADVDKTPVMVYPCSRVDAPVQVDGRLDDPAWAQAAWVSGFVQYNKPEPAAVQTSFRALCGAEALYVGVQCEEPLWQKVAQGAAGLRDEHSAVFGSEAVEVFIDPHHDHNNYYQIAVNAQGTIFDGRGTDAGWNSHSVARCTVSEGRWTMELSIPWADLGVKPQPGMVIGFNVSRDRNMGDREYTTWAHVDANFHDAQHFGHLVLSPTPEMIGGLAGEFRKGGLEGPIRVYAAEGFSGTTYLALAAETLKGIEAHLRDLERIRDQEGGSPVGTTLAKRVAEARETLAPYAEKVRAGQAFNAADWSRADAVLGKLRSELGTAVWEARLSALLDGI